MYKKLTALCIATHIIMTNTMKIDKSQIKNIKKVAKHQYECELADGRTICASPKLVAIINPAKDAERPVVQLLNKYRDIKEKYKQEQK